MNLTWLMVVLTTQADESPTEKKTLPKKMIWKKVNTMLTRTINTYGVTECCGVHRSEPFKIRKHDHPTYDEKWERDNEPDSYEICLCCFENGPTIKCLVYPGEMRQHHCDLLQCRVTVHKGARMLEKWRCEDCLSLTPQCKVYQSKRSRRTLPRHVRDEMKLARHTRKVRYRRMKRQQLIAERRVKKEKLRKQRGEKRNKLRTQPKSKTI